jgi:hypothetical protein
MCRVPDIKRKLIVPVPEPLVSDLRFILRHKGETQMFRRPPSTYLTADELKQTAAIKFNESVPEPELQKILRSNHPQNFKGYLASKELEPPK